jgi:acyl homoserine lactone synthase
MLRITIARAGQAALRHSLLESMYRLRHAVFHDRLGWDVRSEHGREHDWFDAIGPHYVVAHPTQGEARALGCCRLLPTTGPNMLRDVFPQLLDGGAMPEHARVWEISRFAVAEDHTGGGFGFSTVPSALLLAAVRFAEQRGLDAFVGVTSAPIERMLRRLGFTVERLGQPRRIGQVMSLAFRLPMDARSRARVREVAALQATALTRAA